MAKPVPVLKLTERNYNVLTDLGYGFCYACGQINDENYHEPDASAYECQDCGEPTVYGLSNALVDDRILVVEKGGFNP